MKKFLLFTVLIIYTTIASGVNLKFHYCGGKIKSVSFAGMHDDEKGCCGKKMKSKKCCHDKSTSIKLKETHNYTPVLSTPKNFVSSSVIESCVSQLLFSIDIDEPILPDYHAPPILYDNPLFLKNKSLLI